MRHTFGQSVREGHNAKHMVLVDECRWIGSRNKSFLLVGSPNFIASVDEQANCNRPLQRSTSFAGEFFHRQQARTRAKLSPDQSCFRLVRVQCAILVVYSAHFRP